MTIWMKTLVAALLAWAAATAFAGVDVNKATQAELESIKGIGPAMSARILDARKAAAFKDWADLQSRVKGLGDARSARLSADGLTVGGAAFKAGDGTARPAKAPKGSKATRARATDSATAGAAGGAARSK